MLKLVSKFNTMYAVYDDSDDTTDIVTQSELQLLLNIGLNINGAKRVDDNSFDFDSSVSQLSEKEIFEDNEEETVFTDNPFDNISDEELKELYDKYKSEGLSEDDIWDEINSIDCSRDDMGYEEEEEDEYEDDEYNDYDDYEDAEEADSEEEEDDYDDFDIDSDYLDCDDEEDSVIEESVVNKLYSVLTPEQLTALRKYYLWYSRRLFADAQKDPTFGLKDKRRIKLKKNQLDALKGSEKSVWKYAGFIDMGRKGEGFCTLGHPLRYMHIAWDTSVEDIDTAFFGEDYTSKFDEALDSENSIIFGIKCIADFFEVDKECVRALQAAQRDSLKDMAIIYDYYEKGIVEEVKQRFTVLDEFMQVYRTRWIQMKLIGDNSVSNFSPALMEFYMEFRQLGMIPPKSMIQEIRDKLVGWSVHKFSRRLRYPVLSSLSDTLRLALTLRVNPLLELLDDDNWYRRSCAYSFNNGLYLYLTDYFVYKICGAYEWGIHKFSAERAHSYDRDKDDIWKDEGGWSESSRTERREMDTSLSRHFFKDPEYSIAYINKLIDCIDIAKKYVGRDDKFCVPSIVQKDDGFYELTEERSYNSDVIHKYSNEMHNNFSINVDYVEELHRRGLNKYIDKNSRESCTLDEKIEFITNLNNSIDKELPNFIAWAENYLKNEVVKKNEARQKALEEQARREEEQRLAKEKEEQERKELANNSSTDSNSDEVSKKEILDYLETADISLIQNDAKFSFQLKVLNTVKKYGKEPSDKQMVYLRDIYDALHGKSVQTDHRKNRVQLTDRKDLKEAIDWYINLNDSDEKTKAICSSVLKYGTISDKQMKYIEQVRNLYVESEK